MFRIRSTYLYLAVALGLFCYIYFVDVKHKSTSEAALSAGNLYEFNADEVNWLQITNASGSVLLEKKDGRWMITKPVQAVPEAGVMQQVLGELEFIRSQRAIPYSTLPASKEETIKQWNLNPPVVRVEFKTSKENLVLLIGRNVALTDNVYARASDKPDAPVYIIRAAIKPMVDRSLTDMRSRAVFDFDSKEVMKYSAREFTSTSQVSRESEVSFDKGKGWGLQKPIVARADRSLVEQWMRHLQDLRVRDFVSDESSNLSAYGLSSPTAQISVQKNSGDELSLILGSSPVDKPGDIYAKRLRSNSVFTLNKDAVTKLVAGLSDTRDKRLMAVSAPAVTGLIIEQKGRTIGLNRENGQWVFANEPTSTAETALVQGFINLMTTVQSTQFVKDSAADLKTYGLDRPHAKVTLKYMEGKEGKESATVEILFGKGDTKQIFAKTSAEPFIYSVPSGTFDSFPKDEMAWRSLQVLQVDKNSVKELRMTNKNGGQITLIRDNAGQYKASVPDSIVDSAKAEEQVTLLSTLRTNHWLGKAQPSYGLDKPVLKFTLAGNTTTTLNIGAVVGTAGRAAQIEGQSNVFNLNLADFNILDQNPVTPVKKTP